jgi:hypothetical protein
MAMYMLGEFEYPDSRVITSVRSIDALPAIMHAFRATKGKGRQREIVRNFKRMDVKPGKMQ